MPITREVMVILLALGVVLLTVMVVCLAEGTERWEHESEDER